MFDLKEKDKLAQITWLGGKGGTLLYARSHCPVYIRAIEFLYMSVNFSVPHVYRSLWRPKEGVT